MPTPNNIHYWTKDQLERTYKEWDVIANIPKKGEATHVCFPPPAHFNQIVISMHNVKSTYGKTLYKAEFRHV